MDPLEALKGASNISLGLMIFTMWYYENKKREADGKKIDTLQQLVQQQIEEKQMLRQERTQFVELLESHASLIGRSMGLLDRMEQRLGKMADKMV